MSVEADFTFYYVSIERTAEKCLSRFVGEKIRTVSVNNLLSLSVSVKLSEATTKLTFVEILCFSFMLPCASTVQTYLSVLFRNKCDEIFSLALSLWSIKHMFLNTKVYLAITCLFFIVHWSLCFKHSTDFKSQFNFLQDVCVLKFYNDLKISTQVNLNCRQN